MVSTRTDALGLVHEQAQLMFGFDAWPDPRGGTRTQQRVGEIFTGLCRDAGLEVDLGRRPGGPDHAGEP